MDMLPDRYEVRSELGVGGMATVYLAYDTKLERSVAIKVMHPQVAASVGIERFLREVRITAQLRHPNILPLIDSGGSGDFLYYVTPFIEGGSLRDRISREGVLGFDEAIGIACEVAEALSVAHVRQIVHRDIKPENILLDGGHAVVADFGIAKALSDPGLGPTADNAGAIGTPAYSSPEQAAGEEQVDHRSDIYSLGCVLYEMLVGEPPFSGPSREVVLARQISQPPLKPRAVRATIPEALDGAVTKALSKAPQDRYTSADDFRTALEGLGAEEVTHNVAVRRAWLGVMATVALSISIGLWLRQPTRMALDPTRIAVLGFTSADAEETLEAFARNVTDRVRDGLSSIDALSVVSGRGTLPYGDQSLPVDSVARALQAGTLIDGTVVSAGPSVQIRFQVIDGATGDQIGTGSVEAVQRERHLLVNALSDSLIHLLQEELGPSIRSRTLLLRTRSLEAFEHVEWADERIENYQTAFNAGDFPLSTTMLETADSLLREAERNDPGWVEPTARRARLAEHRYSLARARGDTATRELLVEGLEIAEVAIAKEPTDPRAQRVRGGLRYWLWDRHRPPDPDSASSLLRGAETDLRNALLGSPDRAGILRTLSELMAKTGRETQAIQYAEQAYASDPYLENLSQVLNRLFDYNFALERDEAALRWCREGATRRPDVPMFTHCQLRLMAWGRSLPPDYARAVALREQTISNYPPSLQDSFEPFLDLLVAAVAARTGRRLEAATIVERVRAAAPPSSGLVIHEAGLLALLGDTTAAMATLHSYLEDQPEAAPVVLRAREVIGLRRLPEFGAMLPDSMRTAPGS